MKANVEEEKKETKDSNNMNNISIEEFLENEIIEIKDNNQILQPERCETY